MFPLTFENFEPVTDAEYNDMVEGEMTELVNKIDLLPSQMDESVIKNMYGKMEIHDNVMDIYDTDGNIIRTFNLFDFAGNPTTTAGVFKREIQ